MKNWRTTTAGLATAFFGFVLFSPQTFAWAPWLVDIAKYAVAGGLASMGLLGKDYTSHSTVGEVQTATTLQQADDIKAAVKADAK